ncbi:hypothetical protein GFM10_32355 [Pseudomonas aeruginosa]|nr:hypothetical protein [Pseudomonas aeruginosa]
MSTMLRKHLLELQSSDTELQLEGYVRKQLKYLPFETFANQAFGCQHGLGNDEPRLATFILSMSMNKGRRCSL